MQVENFEFEDRRLFYSTPDCNPGEYRLSWDYNTKINVDGDLADTVVRMRPDRTDYINLDPEVYHIGALTHDEHNPKECKRLTDFVSGACLGQFGYLTWIVPIGGTLLINDWMRRGKTPPYYVGFEHFFMKSRNHAVCIVDMCDGTCPDIYVKCLTPCVGANNADIQQVYRRIWMAHFLVHKDVRIPFSTGLAVVTVENADDDRVVVLDPEVGHYTVTYRHARMLLNKAVDKVCEGASPDLCESVNKYRSRANGVIRAAQDTLYAYKAGCVTPRLVKEFPFPTVSQISFGMRPEHGLIGNTKKQCRGRVKRVNGIKLEDDESRVPSGLAITTLFVLAFLVLALYPIRSVSFPLNTPFDYFSLAAILSVLVITVYFGFLLLEAIFTVVCSILWMFVPHGLIVLYESVQARMNHDKLHGPALDVSSEKKIGQSSTIEPGPVAAVVEPIVLSKESGRLQTMKNVDDMPVSFVDDSSLVRHIFALGPNANARVIYALARSRVLGEDAFSSEVRDELLKPKREADSYGTDYRERKNAPAGHFLVCSVDSNKEIPTLSNGLGFRAKLPELTGSRNYLITRHQYDLCMMDRAQGKRVLFVSGGKAVDMSKFTAVVRYDVNVYDVVVLTCDQATETALGVSALSVRKPNPGFGSVVHSYNPSKLGKFPNAWVFSLGQLETSTRKGIWYHTSKTEEGTSGSAVFDRDGFAVGIHFGADYSRRKNLMTSLHWIGKRSSKETASPVDDVPDFDDFHARGSWEEDDGDYTFIPYQDDYDSDEEPKGRYVNGKFVKNKSGWMDAIEEDTGYDAARLRKGKIGESNHPNVKSPEGSGVSTVTTPERKKPLSKALVWKRVLNVVQEYQKVNKTRELPVMPEQPKQEFPVEELNAYLKHLQQVLKVQYPRRTFSSNMSSDPVKLSSAPTSTLSPQPASALSKSEGANPSVKESKRRKQRVKQPKQSVSLKETSREQSPISVGQVSAPAPNLVPSDSKLAESSNVIESRLTSVTLPANISSASSEEKMKFLVDLISRMKV